MRHTQTLFSYWELLVFIVFLLAPLASTEEVARTVNQASRSNLQMALLQARNSLIQLAAEDDSTVDGSIERRVIQLVELLLYAGDREDVRYLQNHLKKVYADKIRSALEPSTTMSDFASRISKADRVTDSFKHDEDLQTIVNQEIERGFLEDAAKAAQKIRLPGSRTSAFIDIALAQHAKGSDTAAEDAVNAAVQACFQPEAGLPLRIDPPDRQLTQIVAALSNGNYAEEAQRVLAEAEKAVQAKTNANSFDWANLAEAAIGIGDLTSATHWMQKVDADAGRPDLEIKFSLAQARAAGRDAEVRRAAKIKDTWLKVSALRDVANRQSDAGDNLGAMTTLQLAIDAAKRGHERTVLLLHDMAWAQIDAGDRIGAEHTLELALQENEEPAYGSDQVDGWALLADTFAFLGHFDRAHKIAGKISNHYFRGRALGFIAQRDVESGQAEQALAWASQLRDPDERSSTYLAIAQAITEELKNESKQ